MDLYCIQPLLIPAVWAEFLVSEIYADLNTQHPKLGQLQTPAGQHKYPNVLSGDPLELDFVSSSRSLNFVSNEVAICVLRLKCVLSALDQMVEWERGFQRKSATDHRTETELYSALAEGGTITIAKIAYLKDTCNVLLFEAECEGKRVQALSQAVGFSSL
jgi:hypothetical protein